MIENRHIWALALTAAFYSILIAIVVPIAIITAIITAIVTAKATCPVTRDRVVWIRFLSACHLSWFPACLPVIVCARRFAPYKTISSFFFFHNRDQFIILTCINNYNIYVKNLLIFISMDRHVNDCSSVTLWKRKKETKVPCEPNQAS